MSQPDDQQIRALNTLTAFRRGSDGGWRIWRDASLLLPA
jgi:ketosteroid isomerase-like protein